MENFEDIFLICILKLSSFVLYNSSFLSCIYQIYQWNRLMLQETMNNHKAIKIFIKTLIYATTASREMQKGTILLNN